jgi:hypothetical protein
MKIITSVVAISCVILLSLFTGACDTGAGQTTGTKSTTTNNQSIQTIIEGEVAGYYANMAELSRETDLIAYGKIDGVIEVKEQIVGHNPKGNNILYFTDFNFNISQCLKGDEKEAVIIHQVGAAGKMVVNRDPLFEQGEEYVLFLRKTESDVYLVLGVHQGRFKVVDGKVYSMDNIIPDKIFINPGLSYNGVELEDFIGYISEELE